MFTVSKESFESALDKIRELAEENEALNKTFDFSAVKVAEARAENVALLEALRKIYLGTSEDHTLAIANEAIREAKEQR